MIRSLATALAPLLLAGSTLGPQEALAATPATPVRWATDSAGFLSEAARQSLDDRLEAYEHQTGHQVLVWIAHTTDGVPLEDFTVKAVAAWHVGRKGLDDGLVLFVFADDRKVRVEVGYGLEGQVPDAIASRIIRETIVPKIQAGDRDGAVQAGVDALIAAIEGRAATASPEAGEPSAGRAPPSEGGPSLGLGQKILIGLLVLGFLILLVTNPSLALYLLFSLLSGGRGGGGSGGGGGGFSGGGGRSGGGGASGSW